MRSVGCSWKNALRVFAAALVVGVGVGWWFYTTRLTYRIGAVRKLLDRGDWIEAQTRLNALAAAGPNEEVDLLQGEIYYRTGRPADAILALNRIQSEGPPRVQAAAMGGWCFLTSQNYWEASRHFQYALSLDSDNLSAHRGMARVYYHQGALAYAEEHLEAVTRLDPKNGEAWQAIGVIHKDIDRHRARAVECFEEALRRELSSADRDTVRYDLAQMHSKMGNPAAALQQLNALDSRAFAERPDVLALRVECLDVDQQTDVARQLLEQSIKDYPQSVELLRVRSARAFRDEKYAEAVVDMERVLKTDKHDYLSRYRLAQALAVLGKSAEATEQRLRAEESRKLLDELTRLNREVIAKPWEVDLQNRLADLCVRLDKHDLASMWRQAASASPAQKVESSKH